MAKKTVKTTAKKVVRKSASKASAKAKTSVKKIATATLPKVGAGRACDIARLCALRHQPFHRGPALFCARHHRSRGRSRLHRLRSPASASRPVREFRHGAGNCGRRQADPRHHSSPRDDAQTGGLSAQQDLYARPAVLCGRAHYRAAVFHRRIAGFSFQRR